MNITQQIVPAATENALTITLAHLSCRVWLSGAKNADLHHVAASLLPVQPLTLRNSPSRLLDAQVHVEMLKVLGKRADLRGHDRITLSQASAPPSRLDW